MAHGDDAGLRLPPAVAPHQVVVVPIFRSDDERARVLEAAASMAAAWRERGLRVKVDARDDLRPGYKFADWELAGGPGEGRGRPAGPRRGPGDRRASRHG